MADAIVSALCEIPGDPDISGIGVRTAIYAQNILCFILAIWALWDGNITLEELENAEKQTTTNLVLAFAILISSIVQALTLGMSSYRGNIVLMMSWMNNTNAFVYFVLYIHHKVGLSAGEGRVEATWSSWLQHAIDKISPFLHYVPGTKRLNDAESQQMTAGTEVRNEVEASPQQRASALISRVALVLGSLHLSLMAALGVWLWSDLHSFGIGNQTQGYFRDANRCAVDSALITILGHHVPLHSSPLRTFSLVFYSAFLVPGVNLILPMVVLLAAYLLLRRLPFRGRWDVAPAYLCLAIPFVINLLFMADIELTLNWNSKNRQQSKEERDWGFGQILALLLLLLPLRDLIEAMLARRHKRRQEELDEDLKDATNKRDLEAMKRAIKRGSAFPSPKLPDYHLKFWNLVATNDALDYFSNLRRDRMTINDKALESDLLRALELQQKETIKALHLQGADLIAGVLHSPEAKKAALWFALQNKNNEVAQFHARCSGKHINEEGPHQETPLTFALNQRRLALAKILLDNPFIEINHCDTRAGETGLICALRNGHEEIVKILLAKDNIEVNLADNQGETALIWASKGGHADIVKVLLKKSNILVNAADGRGKSALVHAAESGHAETVKTLLEHNDIQVNTEDKLGRTTLIHALDCGHVDTAKTLLARDDIQVNTADEHGKTALIYALEGGHVETVKTLLERPDVQVDTGDKRGKTALMYALEGGHAETVKTLLERPDIQINTADKQGRTNMMYAAKGGHRGTVKTLLERDNIQLNMADKQGKTALMLASKDGHADTVKILLERDDILVNAADEWGATALMLALEGGHAATVKILLDRDDIQLNMVDKQGKTALILASEGGHADTVKTLLKRDNVQFNTTGWPGWTALMYASRGGHADTVKTLLQRDDIQVNAANWLGMTALMSASCPGHADTVKVLLQRDDIHVNLVDVDGDTALMNALCRGHEPIAAMLLERTDVDVSVINKEGKTAYMLASERGFPSIAEIIRKRTPSS